MLFMICYWKFCEAVSDGTEYDWLEVLLMRVFAFLLLFMSVIEAVGELYGTAWCLYCLYTW